MKMKILLFLFVFGATAFPLDGFYLGGEIGNVALTGKTTNTLFNSYNNTIGFALDLGFRTNALLDVLLTSSYSSHSGGINGLSLYGESVGASFHLLEANDFDISVGAGPGFYFFKNASLTESHFGIHLGAACDVMADDHIRIGLGLRYHKIFGSNSDFGDNFWTIMMRAGYQFGE